MASSAPRISRAKWYKLLGYEPRLGQRLMDEAADAGKRFLSLFTFPQFGKSYGVAKSVEPSLLLPDTHGWIVAPTYTDGEKEFSYIYKDFAETGVLKMATRKHYDTRGGNMAIEFPWGAWVRVISAENPDNLRREQLDWVILAEASKLPANLYERHLYARMAIRKGKVYVPTTPKGFSWCYEAFRVPSLPVKDRTFQYGPWVNNRRALIGGEPNPDYDPLYWSCVVSAAEEFGDVLEVNVHDRETVARARKMLPRQIFAEQFGGDFASYQGTIYPFDPVVHECDPFPIPSEWRHIVGWDHGAGGGSDPTAILVGSYDPKGCLYWWGEIYDEQVRSVKERAMLLRVMLAGKKLSAPIMRGRDAKQVGTELSEVGIQSTFPDASTVDARIIRKTSLMREGKWKILRRQCPWLKRQVLSNEWDEKNPGKPKDGDDHAVEASGYAELAPMTGMRWNHPKRFNQM